MISHQKLLVAAVFALSIPSTVSSQMEAVTAAGDTVVLYNDGTWEFADPDKTVDELVEDIGLPSLDSIKTNPTKFVKSTASTAVVKDDEGAYEVWYDTKKWKRTPPGKLNEEADMAFTLSKSEGFGVVIQERIEIPMEALRKVAFENAQKADPNVKLDHQEFRTVNGKTVLALEMSGEITGMKFKYFGYYYSDPKGTWQFITFTTQNLYSTIKSDFEQLLNGLVIMDN
jgi:hypothetical protein